MFNIYWLSLIWVDMKYVLLLMSLFMLLSLRAGLYWAGGWRGIQWQMEGKYPECRHARHLYKPLGMV